MVDFNGEKQDNIVDFSARLDGHLALKTRLSDHDAPVDRSPFGRPAYDYIDSGSGSAKAAPLFDFRLHALSGRDKQILQIFGFSMIMACLLMGIAFGLTTAMVQISKLF